MAKMKFEMLEHTADIKFRVYGKNVNEIFENSALAFCEVVGRGRKIKNKKTMKSEIEAGRPDYESFLYMFIDEMIYLLDAEDFLVCGCKAKFESGNLKILFYGDDIKNYENLDHIKSATYSEMYFKQKKDRSWEAQFVLDV